MYFQEIGHSENTKWTKLLILAGTATTIGLSVPVGFNIGVVNTPADVSNKRRLEDEFNGFLHCVFHCHVSCTALMLLLLFIVGEQLMSVCVLC